MIDIKAAKFLHDWLKTQKKFCPECGREIRKGFGHSFVCWWWSIDGKFDKS